MYLQILQPETENAYSQIKIGNVNQIAAFEVNDSARTINGQSYRQYVSENLLIGSIISNEILELI